MSSPAAPGPAEGDRPADRRRSLGKYVKRMSSVFKREKSNKISPTASTPATPTTAVPAKIEEKPARAATPPAVPVATTATQQVNRSAMQQERARALFAKYGLTLESHEWIAAPSATANVQRVEKPIRMRVHRECHRCGTTYGADKICVKCEHKRCKKCPRYPKKKSSGEKGRDTDGADKPRKKRLLTITSRSGGELAYQPVTQRVRRTCHKCEAFFIPPTSTICQNCRHIRCTKCPRDPAKLQKWPEGYPGDAEADSETEMERELERMRRTWRRPRTRVRWECEECHSLFLDGSPQCPGCGHERCEKCNRKPLKRIKKEKEFDPELVRAVEAKLKAMAVDDDDPSAAEAT